MAKFFYNKVYNSKRTIINVIIISVCVIGIVICFVLTSNFQGENQNTPEGALSIKTDVTVEVNDSFSKELFFSKIENVKLDDINIEYPNDYNISKIGKYDIKIIIDGKTYNSTLNVVDTTKPELTLKEVAIKPNTSYDANDFVSSCTDNSGDACSISFYKGLDENAVEVDYSKYREIGIYPIKIQALDEAGNQSVVETKLAITNLAGDKPSEPTTPTTPEQPVVCKFGNSEYDESNFTLAIDITTNNCAVSLDLYKTNAMSDEINKLLETDTIRIIKDVNALNIEGTPSLNRLITAVVNKTGDGIVGYQLRMTVKIDNNGKIIDVVDYKLDKNGKRVFISNPYNLSN